MTNSILENSSVISPDTGTSTGVDLGLSRPQPEPGGGGISARGKQIYFSDLILLWLARASAVLVLLMMGSLLFVLTRAAIPSMKTFGAKFLITSTWRPNIKSEPVMGPDGKYLRDENNHIVKREIPPQFGALPVIYGTAVSSGIALLLAVPLSLGAALFLTRIAPRPLPPWFFAIPIAIAAGLFVYVNAPGSSIRRLMEAAALAIFVGSVIANLPPSMLTNSVSFLIEFLAAIPSIAYGIWGLFKLRPFLANHVEPPLNDLFARVPGLHWLHFDSITGLDMFSGGLILGIMVIPIITAVSRDVLSAVPRIQLEGTQALGATWWQSSWEMLRYSRSGLFGAVILGLARAAGETMAITMVIGNSNIINASPFAPAQTMASLLAQQFGNPENDLHRAALLEVALILLVMSLLFNVTARWLVVGKQSRSAAAH